MLTPGLLNGLAGIDSSQSTIIPARNNSLDSCLYYAQQAAITAAQQNSRIQAMNLLAQAQSNTAMAQHNAFIASAAVGRTPRLSIADIPVISKQTKGPVSKFRNMKEEDKFISIYVRKRSKKECKKQFVFKYC